MLATALATIFCFALLMGLLALGVIARGKPLAGSCGGNPDSAHCGCTPEKRAACRERAAEDTADLEAFDEDNVFSGPLLTEETLAPPGERRLIQLRTGRE